MLEDDVGILVFFFADVFFLAFSMLGEIFVKMGLNDLEEG